MLDGDRFVRFGLDVKRWQEKMPSVEVARPSRCRGCGDASRPVGERIRLHGHGLRERMMLGKLDPADRAEVHSILLRRYRCTGCGAVTVVGPRGLLPRHHYGFATILLALWLWAGGEPAAHVRDAVRPWAHSGACCANRWSRLQYWTRLLSAHLDVNATGGLRNRAMRCVQLAGAYGSAGALCAASVMTGSAHISMMEEVVLDRSTTSHHPR